MGLGKWEVSNSLDRASQRSLGSALLIMLWVLGIKIASGAWAVFFAIFTPYGWYLGTEAIAKFIGIIG